MIEERELIERAQNGETGAFRKLVERNKKNLAIKEKEVDRLNKEIGKSTGNWGPAWFLAGASIGIVTSVVIFFISVQTVNNTDLGPS